MPISKFKKWKEQVKAEYPNLYFEKDGDKDWLAYDLDDNYQIVGLFDYEYSMVF